MPAREEAASPEVPHQQRRYDKEAACSTCRGGEMRCSSPCSPPGGSARSAVAHCKNRNLVSVRVRMSVGTRVRGLGLG
jgi:hypothetical protein